MSKYKGVCLWDEYMNWLINYVGFKKRGYNKLIHKLHSMDFYYSVRRDKNRYEDGLYLRERYFQSIGIKGEFKDYDCSVLEMLVAFAVRIEYEFIGDPDDEHPEMIFWEMLSNIELDDMNDSCFDEEEVEFLVERWMHREFDFYGNGSIFPLKDPICDQREAEMWSQMNAYVGENF